MTITPQFLDELRSRVPVSDVVGKRVKLAKKGREFSGLCPFHSEKTPSFTVNDDKAFFHCFGCGAHGDVIRFVTETEGLSFPEAVGKLAGMAGLTVPEATPRERERAARAKTLQEACEAALRFYRRRLNEPDGEAARAYLRRRGLRPETVEAFGLGWAPDGRRVLKQILVGEGYPEALLVEAGLLIEPEDGGESYDRFRGRVIFPIADRRGRVIAFGGRALGDIKPKYLNSPETPLFSKGRLLYALDKARQAVRDGADVIVTEGYMDVIALNQAGFGGAVAPLGTALTESQIEELWRLAPEPVLCFDGDEAGRRAAGRALDRLLPRLVPGKTARFIFLPEGEDPDSFVNLSGAETFGRMVDRAISVSDALWRRVARSQTINSPEIAMVVEKNIEETVAQMAERNTQFYYRVFLKKRLFSLLWDKRDKSGKANVIEMKSDVDPEANVANAQKGPGLGAHQSPLADPQLRGAAGRDRICRRRSGKTADGSDPAAQPLRGDGSGRSPKTSCGRGATTNWSTIFVAGKFTRSRRLPIRPAIPRFLETAWKDALQRQNLISAGAELQQRLKRGLYREDDAEYARLTEFAADIARQTTGTDEADPA